MNKKNTSILIIGINFYPEPTGIGKYTGEFAFALAEKGYQVEVITGFPYYPQWKVYEGYKNIWYRRERIKNIAVTRCPMYVPGSLSGMKRMMQDMSFFLSALGSIIGKMVKGKRHDVVFVASPSFLSGVVGLFYKLFNRNIKFIYHVQDLQIDAAAELKMINNSTLLNVLKWAEGRVLKGADYVSTISQGMQNSIAAKPFKIKQQLIFPNWVNFTSIFKKEPDVDRIAQLGFPVNKKIVLYSGAVGEKQGLEIVLQAAGIAITECPDLIFVISGSGPYASVLKTNAEKAGLSNLFFIDPQPVDVFNELLNLAFLHLVIQKDKASDLLLPSKLTNILAVGGIAIVTAAPGTSLYDIVYANKLGVIAPPDNPQTFWEAIKEVYSKPERLYQLKTNAVNYAANYLDKDVIIDRFLKETNLAGKLPKQKYWPKLISLSRHDMIKSRAKGI